MKGEANALLIVLVMITVVAGMFVLFSLPDYITQTHRTLLGLALLGFVGVALASSMR